MPDYDNRNRFALFRNTRKREGKNDPDFSGTFHDVDGRAYFMDAWSTEPKNGGDKFLSGSIKLKGEARPAPAPKKEMAELDDDLPF